MAYCVKCGVELAEYSKSCPLCRTEVADSAVSKETENIDYPNYRTPSMNESKRVNRIFVGRLLSMMFLNYAVILIIINLSVNKAVTWSLIPVISIALLWFGVAFPFFKKRSTFFELYTYDSIAAILYVIGLNLIISGDLVWAKYAALSIGLVWAVLAGFFIGSKIRKSLPVVVFYIVISVIFFAAFAFAINNRLSAFRLIMPIMGVVLAVALFSYFIITARAGGVLGILWVVFVSVSALSLALDAIISNYIVGHVALTWSLIVNAVTVPMFVTSLTVKKSRELKAIISKRLHR